MSQLIFLLDKKLLKRNRDREGKKKEKERDRKRERKKESREKAREQQIIKKIEIDAHLFVKWNKQIKLSCIRQKQYKQASVYCKASVT